MNIQPVSDLKGLDISELLRESTFAGFRHMNRLVSEYEAGTNIFSLPGEALFAAWHYGKPVGTGGGGS